MHLDVRMGTKLVFLLLLVACDQVWTWQKSTPNKLYLVTVATEETDGFRRMKRSALEFGYDLHAFGMGQKWSGGSMETEVRSSMRFNKCIRFPGRWSKDSSSP
jgi:hypothetical protein